MIENRILSSEKDDHFFSDAQSAQDAPDNGSLYYAIITVGGIAGLALGAIGSDPLVGLFTGIGAGVAGSIAVIAARQVFGLFRRD